MDEKRLSATNETKKAFVVEGLQESVNKDEDIFVARTVTKSHSN